jgi:hypothetical protein
VPVRELADPSTVEMGEAASPSAGCREVDADVVQIEATLRIAPSGHRHFSSFVSPGYFSRVGAIAFRLMDLGRPAVRISHAVDESVAESLATSGISCDVYLPAAGNVEKLTDPSWEGFDIDTTVSADHGRAEWA